MRKNYRFFTVCLFILTAFVSFAQTCVTPPIAADECANAPLFSCNLDGYSGSSAGFTASPAPTGFCGTIENDQYFKFIADENFITFKISFSNCSDNTKGLQAAVYETADCSTFNLVSNCASSTNQNDITIVSNTTITIGNTYYLVLDGVNGNICDFTISVLAGILSDVDAVANNQSVCINGETVLDASSSVVTNSTYIEWTTSNGNIVSGANTLTPTIDKPGFYTLSLKDTITCCSSSKTISVNNYTTKPSCLVSGKTLLTCTDNLLTLDGSGSSGAVDFLWSTPNGNITTPVDQTSIMVDSAGDYSLVVADANGCTSETTLNIGIDTTSPDANAAFVDKTMLSCNTSDLDITGSSTSAVSYTWTGPNSFSSSNQTTNINTAGTYQLITTDSNNGCTGIADLIVPIDTISPMADAGPDTTLNCTNSMIEIGTDNTDSGANISYLWLDSSLANKGSSKKIQVSKSDTYKIIVTNSTNGCSNESAVVVNIDTLKPNLILSPTQVLNCANSTANLTMNEGSGISTIDYLWTDSGVLHETTNSITVSTADTYHALMTNTANGCTASGDVLVLNTTNSVIADAGPDITINCFQPIKSVGGTSSSAGTDIKYTWKNSNDITVGIESTLNVGIPDTFYLTVLDNSTGCSAMDTVIVTEDKTTSIASINNTEDTINCVRNSILLNGLVNDNAINYMYKWLDPDYNLLTDVADVVVTSGGNYHFEITRDDNGCKDTASIIIYSDTATSQITIANPAIVTCKNSPVQLSTSVVSPSYSENFWTTSDGHFASPQNLLSPFVDQGGTYNLVVTVQRSGCTSTASINVMENTTPPIAKVIDDIELNCLQSNINLVDNSTSSGNTFTYEWKNQTGTVISNDYSIVIDSANLYSLIVTDTINGCTAQDIVQITENKVYPSTVIGITEDTITCDRASVQISGGANNSGSAIGYNWYDENWNIITSGVTEFVATRGGKYHFEAVRGDNFCKDTFDFEIFANNTPPDIVMGTADLITCSNPFISLPASVSSPNNQLTYAWSTTDGNITSATDMLNIFVDEGGTYTLSVSDLTNGCSSNEDITALSDTITPIADAGVDFELNCAFESLNLGGSNTSTGSQYAYVWKDNSNVIIATTKNKNINTPDTYELLVTDKNNGCTASDRIVVTEDKVNPVAVINHTTDTINCFAPQLTLDGSTSTPNNIDYEWKLDNQSVSTDAIYFATKGGQYSLKVKNQNNKCENEITIDIAEDKDVPTIQITDIEQINCTQTDANIDMEIQPSTGNYAFDWTTTNGNFSGPIDQLDTKVNLASDDYMIEVTNQDNGCTATNTVTVSEDIETPKVTLDVSDELNCLNEKVNISTTPLDPSLNLTYDWSGPSILGNVTTTKDIQVNQQGDYSLIVRNTQNGCTSQSIATVAENTKRPRSAEIFFEDPTCFEDRDGNIIIDTVIGGNLPLEYKINEFPFKNGNDFKNLNAGSYTITIRDNIGCTWDTIIDLAQPRPITVKILGDLEVQLGETVNLFAQSNNNSLDLEWFENDVQLEDTATQIFVEPTNTSQYLVIAYDENGCSAQDRMELKVINDKTMYFPMAITPNGDGQNDIFYCFSEKSVEKVLSLEVFDRWGEKVFERTNFQPNDPVNGWDGKLKGSFVNLGIYIYSAEVLFKDGKRKVFSGDFSVLK